MVTNYSSPSSNTCSNLTFHHDTTKIHQVQHILGFLQLKNTQYLQPPPPPITLQYQLTFHPQHETCLTSLPQCSSVDPFPSPPLRSPDTREIQANLNPTHTRWISLKKLTLDPEPLLNYRPISTLLFITKILERVASIQLPTLLSSNKPSAKFQSYFRLNRRRSSHQTHQWPSDDLWLWLHCPPHQSWPSLCLIMLITTSSFATFKGHWYFWHRLSMV